MNIHPLIFSYTPENALRQYQDYYYQTGKYPYANLLWMTIKYCNMCNSLRSSLNHNDKYKELRMELTNVNLNRAMDILKILLDHILNYSLSNFHTYGDNFRDKIPHFDILVGI